jgi:diaminopimelate epimerase
MNRSGKMNTMKFAKMSAVGNDFILFDNREKIFKGDERDYFRHICQRRFSVGADGVILLEQSDSADFKYRHFNSDGQSAQICGNGARAICRYAYLKKLSGKNITFEANGVLYHGSCSGDQVTVDHPEPLDVQTQIGIVNENFFEEGGFVIIGVPHLVIFCENIQTIDVNDSGKKYRDHPLFDQGTNVNFVQIMSANTLRVRTYERGVEGETFSCGTGAMASALISHLSKGIKTPVKVRTRGGKLTVDWNKGFSPLYLSGKATLVFEGQFIEK